MYVIVYILLQIFILDIQNSKVSTDSYHIIFNIYFSNTIAQLYKLYIIKYTNIIIMYTLAFNDRSALLTQHQ